MATWLYVKNGGDCLWYKYYCRKCRKWIVFTLAWNLEAYGCKHYENKLPWKDGTIASNPGWFATKKWVKWYDLDEVEEYQ